MKKGVISVLSALAGAAVGAAAGGASMNQKMGKELSKKSQMSEKHLALFLMMNQWVKVKQEGKNLSAYFEKEGFKNIAVYGMSYAGETLIDELKNTDIHVAYGIDKNAGTIYTEVDIIGMEEPFDEVDAIVVTAITFFDEIEEKLREKVSCPIVSLEDILYEI
ncbi:MAG: hypothetical protein K2L07_16345 [Lachnospiraceae bacterium]|nr:hypothetical protein [Lachnospiraceae bacterium]